MKKADFNKATILALYRLTKPYDSVINQINDPEQDEIDIIFNQIHTIYGVDATGLLETLIHKLRHE